MFGLDANNISTIDTVNNYKYCHMQRGHGHTGQEHGVCCLSELARWGGLQGKGMLSVCFLKEGGGREASEFSAGAVD